MDKKFAYTINGTDFIEIYELAIKLAKVKGKKPGEDIGEEFMEASKQLGKEKSINFIGQTNQDIDLLSGNLREQGIKVLNLNEELRKKK